MEDNRFYSLAALSYVRETRAEKIFISLSIKSPKKKKKSYNITTKKFKDKITLKSFLFFIFFFFFEKNVKV